NRKFKPRLAMNSKSIFKSKTAAAQALTFAAAFYPPATAFVAAHPEETLGLLAVVNLALRWLTKGRVSLIG
ncbi:MAG: hypothetical protein LDL31_03805, partial [Prosthecobacter sp.]|nr:hypothetical protein [Prosthecobacter sp.]